MSGELCTNNPLQLRVLSHQQCERIKGAAVEVLARTGARFHEPEAIEILKAAGCNVSDGTRVHFPGDLIDQTLGSAVREFTLYSRDGRPAIEVGSGRAHFGPGPTCCNFIDPETGQRRLFVKGDAALTARVCDRLENIDYVMSLGSISDVPPEKADIHEFEAMVRETTKPIMSWSFSRDSLEQIHRMCAEVKGSAEACSREPFMIFYAEPISPLKHSAEAVQKLIYCARHGIPLVYTPCPIAGGTAPVTLAGLLVQNLAETLGGVVLSQLIRKGTPIVVGGVVSILDMRTTILAYGAPELSLLSAAATEVARHLGLPMFSTAGCTDAKCLDQQAAIEATTSIVFAALSGADFVHDVGYTESGMTGSLEQLVMGDEIIAMARHIVRGIRVDDETLAVEVIAEGVDSGDFLSLTHTRRHFREQLWPANLMDRRRRQQWADDGATTMGDRVGRRMREIIAEHRAAPLSDQIISRLSSIVSG